MLQRASDNATKDIAILPSGDLDVATAEAFCSGTTCSVIHIWDQTGNNNHAMVVPASVVTGLNPFTIQFNAKGKLPAIVADGHTTTLRVNRPNVGSGPVSIAYSAKDTNTGRFSTLEGLRSALDDSSSNFTTENDDKTGHMSGNSSFLRFPMPRGIWHTVFGVFSDNTTDPSIAGVDGVETSGVCSTKPVSLPAQWFNVGDNMSNGADECFGGLFGEVGLWGSHYFTSTERQALTKNMATYWGTPSS